MTGMGSICPLNTERGNPDWDDDDDLRVYNAQFDEDDEDEDDETDSEELTDDLDYDLE